jgi:TM2 domain-containing membrane protein YozV
VKKTFFIIFVFLFSFSSLWAEENSFIRKQKAFARELYIKGRYFDYIAEAERLRLFYKDESLDYCIYSAYYHGGQYNTIVDYYRYYSENDKMKLPAALLVSGSYAKLKDYHKSYSILKNFSYEDIDKDLKLSLFAGRIESLIYRDDLNSIKQEISAASPFLKDYNSFLLVSKALLARENIRIISAPGSAVMSAFIPGAGQIYSGDIYEGVLSFLSVASTLAGGFYLKKKGEKNSSYTVFFFSGLFYTGNIYGAYNSALSSNNRVLKSWRSAVSDSMEPFNPDKYCIVE